LISKIQRFIWLKILSTRDATLRLPDDTSQSLEASKLWPILSGHPTAFVVDIGSNNGFTFSNSYFFIKQGWEALLVEPIKETMQGARDLHRANPRVRFGEIAVSDKASEAKIFLDKFGNENLFATIVQGPSRLKDRYVSKENFRLTKTQTLRDVLNEFQVPREFALLSIDVEGHESSVLSTLRPYRPAVIVVERSLQNVEESFKKQKILTDYEYIFAARIGCNEVYIDKKSDFIKDNLEGFEKISSIGI
jgi:FkbM family methyltransferase